MLGNCVFSHEKLYSHKAICSYIIFFCFARILLCLPMNGVARNFSQFCGPRAIFSFAFISLVPYKWNAVNGTVINLKMVFVFRNCEFFPCILLAFHGPAAICSVDRHCNSITNRSYEFLFTFALPRSPSPAPLDALSRFDRAIWMSESVVKSHDWKFVLVDWWWLMTDDYYIWCSCFRAHCTMPTKSEREV